MERKSIGAFLAVLRKANGMTQQQVAECIEQDGQQMGEGTQAV